MKNLLNQHIIRRCLTQIKLRLKEKAYTYQHLSELLGVSENTIKRMLNSTDIGLDRLLTLADLCGLNLGELIETARQSPEAHHYFTERQDQAFFQSPHLWSYFHELFYTGKSPQKIAREHNLDDVSTYRYLRTLENIGLIELEPDNEFRFSVTAPVGFSANSKVLQANIQKYLESTYEAVTNPKKDERFFMFVKPLKLPQSLMTQLKEDLIQTLEKYAEISESPVATEQDFPEHQVVFAGHPLDTSVFALAKIIPLENG